MVVLTSCFKPLIRGGGDLFWLHRLKQAFHKARHLEALLLRRKVVADELVDPFAGGFDFSQLNERLAGFGAELVACDVDFQ